MSTRKIKIFEIFLPCEMCKKTALPGWNRLFCYLPI